MSKISETRVAMPTKIGLHAFHIKLYLLEFLKPILFLTAMDYSPWSKRDREFWPFLKGSKITKTGEAMSSKICLHAFYINLYLHEYLSWFYFWPPWTIVHGLKGNVGHFEGKWKTSKISKTIVAMPTKTGLHALLHFMSTSTCLIFLSRFYFLTPMNYSLWSEREIWPFWRQTKNKQNLQNCSDHAHQNWFACISHQLLLAWIYELILFFDPMDYIHGPKGKFGHFEGKQKWANLWDQSGHVHQNWFASTSTCLIFLSRFYFLTLEGKQRGGTFLNSKRPCPLNLMHMYTSTSTCMNVL